MLIAAGSNLHEGNGYGTLKRKRDDTDPEVDNHRNETKGASSGYYELEDEEGDEGEQFQDEPSRFGSQVLPVADLPDDYDGEPQDGFEYLFTVRRAAAALPIFTKTVNPFHAVVVEENPPQVPPPKAHSSAVPSEAWRATFNGRFDKLRKTFSEAVESTDPRPVIRLPHQKDRDAWWKFINGTIKPTDLQFESPDISWPIYGVALSTPGSKVEIVGADKQVDDNAETESLEEGEEDEEDERTFMIQKTFILLDDSPHVSQPDPAIQAMSQVERELPLMDLKQRKGYSPRPPMFALVTQLENKATFLLLMFFSFWINTRLEANPSLCDGSANQPALSPNDGKWLFALLARLDEHLSGEQISTLRVLARACLSLLVGSLKGKSTPQDDSVVLRDGRGSCWMVIAAVSHTWGQRDLWEEAVKAVDAAPHRLHVKSLYKRYLTDSLNWCVRRDVWRQRAIAIRSEFESNRNVRDPRALAEIFEKAEAQLAAKQHPDPYIPSMMPGGTKWERNLPPPTGPIFDHEAEAHH